MSKELEELQKKYDELKAQFEISLMYTAFVYGMASSGDPLAIKLVKLHAKDEDQAYVVSMEVKK